MKETCGVCGRPLERGDAMALLGDPPKAIHTTCITWGQRAALIRNNPTDNARQLLTTLNVDELFTIRENLESRYTILRAELDEINACVWRCDNEIARRRHA